MDGARLSRLRGSRETAVQSDDPRRPMGNRRAYMRTPRAEDLLVAEMTHAVNRMFRETCISSYLHGLWPFNLRHSTQRAKLRIVHYAAIVLTVREWKGVSIYCNIHLSTYTH